MRVDADISVLSNSEPAYQNNLNGIFTVNLWPSRAKKTIEVCKIFAVPIKI